MRDIWQTVRSRILDLTLEIERKIPDAEKVTVGNNLESNQTIKSETNNIFNQIIYGDVSYINASDGSTITISVIAGDKTSLSNALTQPGIPEEESKEFARIVSEETPDQQTKTLGVKAVGWIKNASIKAASGAWKIGSSVLTDLATEAALKFYGFK